MRIQFGGCDGSHPNCTPITKGWNYWVRLYRPRKEILNSAWKFPEDQAVVGEEFRKKMQDDQIQP
jgi:hypothetical protein